jgi:hypothetical protein
MTDKPSREDEFEPVGVYATGVTCKAKLTAANERIRELESAFQGASNMAIKLRGKLTAEREVSDKLATALQRIAKLRIVEADEIIDDYVDLITKVAAVRATNTNREQAD